jgi:alkyl sulfatase BDS1-like metallo-beta-lactamase superfamily hydrolase
VDYLKKQRDMYKYIHDETMRLANQGYTLLEIPEIVESELPAELFNAWYNRGYYGTVSHNCKAVYQHYLGFFDGNPANLHPLPPADAGKKYVEFMGGADNLLANARKSFDKGEYRWVAQVVNHLVFADPDNQAARALQADALEQLGYQAESGPWRNFYLSAAKELRDGVIDLGAPKTASPDVIKAMSLDMFFDLLAVRLIGPQAAGKKLVFNTNFTDTGEQYLLVVENCVLQLRQRQAKRGGRRSADHDPRRAERGRAGRSQTPAGEAGRLASQASTATRPKLVEFLSLLDTFEFWFNIVTP